jgi:hypothetical protein
VCCTGLTGVGALLWKSSSLAWVIRLLSRVTRCAFGECRVIRRSSRGDPAGTSPTGGSDWFDRCGLGVD